MLTLLAGLAHAFESEPQPVALEDSAELFTSIEYSTGILPSGSPVGVEFALEATGGAGVGMEGEGNLSWPEALSLAFTPESESGSLAVDVSLDVVTNVVVDLTEWADYYGEFEIDRRGLDFDGGTIFDPFVLDGGEPDRVELTETTDSTQLIQYSYEIWAGISLNFDAEMTPTLLVGFEGVQWALGDEAVLDSADTAVQLSPQQVASLDLEGIFTAAWDASLAIVFTPTISVSAPFIDDIEIASFDIPVELATEQFEQDFPPETYSFPLPWLVTGIDSGSFDVVEVGGLANLELPIQNLGDLLLQGSARIEGASDFSVYPESFGALPGEEDGLVVSFAPTVDGEQSATLVLESNDPTMPTLEIALVGNGVDDDETDVGGYAEDEEIKAETSTCGCRSTPAGPGALLLLLAGALARRRR